MNKQNVVPNAKVIIIGGGNSGRETAKSLLKLKASSIVIVQPHKYCSSPTLMPYWLEHHDQIGSKWNTKNGTVADISKVGLDGVAYSFGEVTAVNVDAKSVSIKSCDGKMITLQYDALIVASGIVQPLLNPTGDYSDMSALKKLYTEELPKQIAEAKSILIGGAGPVACEVANTVRALNRSCKLTMVSSGETAVPQWKGTAASKVKGQLKRLNINLIKNERLAQTDFSLEPGTYTLTKSGSTIDADIYLPYFGFAATGFMPAGTVTGSGRVLVNEFGQSTSSPNIFAVGVSDKVLGSLFDNILMESQVVSANVAGFLKGAATLPKKLKTVPAKLMYMHWGLGTYSIINPPFPGNVCCTLAGCPLCFFCPCCMACGWNGCFPASGIGSKFMEFMVVKQNGAPSHADFKKLHNDRTPNAAVMER